MEIKKSNTIREYKYFNNELLDNIDNSFSSDFNYFSPVWNEVLKTIDIHNLLDVGCGTGNFSCNLKSKISGKLIGVDGSSYALEKAKEKGFDEVYKVEDLCTQPIPLETESVDFALCKDVFEHLLDPLYLLSEIQRVLVPGGYLLTLVPNHFPIAGRLKFLLTNNLDTFNYFPNSKAWNLPHIRFYNYENFVDFLGQANFRVVENYSGFFPKLPIFHRALRLLAKSLVRKLATSNPTQFAEGLTVLVQKE
ncbi:class I SAM-dependent methyltransferase [Scytonema sp. PCC 10023]|uniref:class I SAM-dependent methyltransferase n=1 Tax=Scytonema sp. PCC 10023 TaxID=1680591 RepID=UPI0039C6CE88